MGMVIGHYFLHTGNDYFSISLSFQGHCRITENLELKWWSDGVHSNKRGKASRMSNLLPFFDTHRQNSGSDRHLLFLDCEYEWRVIFLVYESVA